jgi:hypothetical protein
VHVVPELSSAVHENGVLSVQKYPVVQPLWLLPVFVHVVPHTAPLQA